MTIYSNFEVARIHIGQWRVETFTRFSFIALQRGEYHCCNFGISIPSTYSNKLLPDVNVHVLKNLSANQFSTNLWTQLCIITSANQKHKINTSCERHASCSLPWHQWPRGLYSYLPRELSCSKQTAAWFNAYSFLNLSSWPRFSLLLWFWTQP